MSLYSEVAEIEHHLHADERWLEVAASPSGETHAASRMGTDQTNARFFRIDAGNSTWGAWTLIIGSGDTPVDAGNAFFDFHRLVICASERAAPYMIQMGFGTVAGGTLTGDIVDLPPYCPTGTNGEQLTYTFQAHPRAVGTKVWMRCLCKGQNTATLDFYIGLHEYPVFTDSDQYRFDDGAVWCIIGDGTSGTAWPSGTSQSPCGSIDDAFIIADSNKLRKVYFYLSSGASSGDFNPNLASGKHIKNIGFNASGYLGPAGADLLNAKLENFVLYGNGSPFDYKFINCSFVGCYLDSNTFILDEVSMSNCVVDCVWISFVSASSIIKECAFAEGTELYFNASVRLFDCSGVLNIKTTGVGKVLTLYNFNGRLLVADIAITINIYGGSGLISQTGSSATINKYGFIDEVALAVVDGVVDAIKLKTDLLNSTLAGKIDSNILAIEGELTSGNNATLNLKKLNIVNGAGDAIVASAANGNGINASSTGTGFAILADASGASAGYSGIKGVGSGDGHGVLLMGGALGNGARVVGGGTSGEAIKLTVSGANSDGLKITSGASAKDINAKEITNLTTNLATVDTVVDAVKVKTDNLPASPAAVGSNMGSVTSVIADVGITQAAADKVWGTTVRTLSSFGTLVADIWAYATRTLTAISDSSGITTLLTRLPAALSFTGANVNAESKVTAAPTDMALDSTVAKTLELQPAVDAGLLAYDSNGGVAKESTAQDIKGTVDATSVQVSDIAIDVNGLETAVEVVQNNLETVDGVVDNIKAIIPACIK